VKRVGDRCDSADDCLPTPAVPTSETSVVNTYLACDSDAGTCVETAAPVVPDFLGPCAIDAGAVPDGARGFLESTKCSGGLCIVTATSECVAEGCTVRCEGDHECPQGSICKPLTYDEERDVGPKRGACKPGPIDVWPSLPCPTPDAGADG